PHQSRFASVRPPVASPSANANGWRQLMKRSLLLVVLLGCLAISSTASAEPTDATVCDILANPAAFDGKTVRISGTVIAGFEEFQIVGLGCKQPVKAIWLK